MIRPGIPVVIGGTSTVSGSRRIVPNSAVATASPAWALTGTQHPGPCRPGYSGYGVKARAAPACGPGPGLSGRTSLVTTAGPAPACPGPGRRAAVPGAQARAKRLLQAAESSSSGLPVQVVTRLGPSWFQAVSVTATCPGRRRLTGKFSTSQGNRDSRGLLLEFKLAMPVGKPLLRLD